MKSKVNIQVGDWVRFHSGNYANLTGQVANVDWNSKDPRAIYGFLHTVLLSNGTIGCIEKGEHWNFVTQPSVTPNKVKEV